MHDINKLREKIECHHKDEAENYTKMSDLLGKSEETVLNHIFEDEELRKQARVSFNDQKLNISLPHKSENITNLFCIAEHFFRSHLQSVMLYYKHDRVALEINNMLSEAFMKRLFKVVPFGVVFFLPIFLRTEVVSAAEILSRVI